MESSANEIISALDRQMVAIKESSAATNLALLQLANSTAENAKEQSAAIRELATAIQAKPRLNGPDSKYLLIVMAFLMAVISPIMVVIMAVREDVAIMDVRMREADSRELTEAATVAETKSIQTEQGARIEALLLEAQNVKETIRALADLKARVKILEAR